MRFLSPHTARRNPPARSGRNPFRPRLEALEDRCLLSAGALDTTFNTTGLVTAPIRGNGVGFSAVVVQPDGKIVAGGGVTGTGGINNEFALVRYNADGSLDTTFGNNGVVVTAIDSSTSYLYGLAIEPIVINGEAEYDIVAAGTALGSSGEGFAVARYLPNGALDATFGSGGIVFTTMRNNSLAASAVAIQGSQIYVAGAAGSANGAKFTEFALARYNANGTLDTNFGPSHNGIVVTPQFVRNQGDSATALAIQSDGKIVLAGTTFGSASQMAVVRYTPTGVLDKSFNGSGIVKGLAPVGSTYAYAWGVLVQSNGAIVVAGYSTPGATLARLTSSGQLDKTFGSQGYAVNSNLATGYAVGAVDFSGGDSCARVK
jgi:uncharacterized delta-60 repeat protein